MHWIALSRLEDCTISVPLLSRPSADGFSDSLPNTDWLNGSRNKPLPITTVKNFRNIDLFELQIVLGSLWTFAWSARMRIWCRQVITLWITNYKSQLIICEARTVLMADKLGVELEEPSKRGVLMEGSIVWLHSGHWTRETSQTIFLAFLTHASLEESVFFNRTSGLQIASNFLLSSGTGGSGLPNSRTLFWYLAFFLVSLQVLCPISSSVGKLQKNCWNSRNQNVFFCANRLTRN